MALKTNSLSPSSLEMYQLTLRRPPFRLLFSRAQIPPKQRNHQCNRNLNSQCSNNPTSKSTRSHHKIAIDSSKVKKVGRAEETEVPKSTGLGEESVRLKPPESQNSRSRVRALPLYVTGRTQQTRHSASVHKQIRPRNRGRLITRPEDTCIHSHRRELDHGSRQEPSRLRPLGLRR